MLNRPDPFVDAVEKRVAIVGVLVAASSALLAADTYPRQHAVDAVHYRFALTVTDTSPWIEGEATVTFRLLATVDAIELDLVSAAGGTGMTVGRVMLGAREVSFVHRDDRLRLPVPAAATSGDELAYTVSYAGVPKDGLRVVPTMHGDWSVFSQNWPDRARHWLPMIDHPYDKATADLIVTAPSGVQVVSNGQLVEEVDLDRSTRRTHWRQSVPIASWLYAIGVASFDVHHVGVVRGVPLQTWVFPKDREAGRRVFEDTSRRALEFFSDRIGPYPYAKLANVQAAGAGGGMEHATAIFYGEKGVASGRAPVVHEIAHQWFGNSITERDWDDVWLSEGFATYFALLFAEHDEGRDAFVGGLQRSRATVVQLTSKLPDTPIIHRNLNDMDRVLNQLVYQKGAWVLHMLRQRIGTEAFWRGIAAYYRRHRDGNASTDDFRREMERVSGEDLAAFFAQWLTRSGIPRLEGEWRYDPARQQVEITIRQAQSGSAFHMPLDLALTLPGADGVRVERVLLDGASHVFTFAASVAPSGVTLDPHTTLLADYGELSKRP